MDISDTWFFIEMNETIP